MKKVLVFGVTDNPGGIESVIMNYYRKIDKNKVHFDFLCNNDTVAYRDEIQSLGGKIFHITMRSKNYARYKKDMKDFFKEHAKEYDAIWVNVCSLANIDYLKYAKKYGIERRIIHCHNSQNMDSFLRGLLHRLNRRRVRKLATDFWSCSNEASNWFYSKELIASEKYKLINNAIDLEKFSYNEKVRNAIRKKMHWGNQLIFGNVGRLHFQKNQSFAIDVFNEVLKIKPDSQFVLIGDGEDKEKLEEKVEQLGISDNVSFLGLQKNVNELLQGMDIFLFPSLFEGLSLSLIEAQASGILIFTSNNISKETFMSDNIHELDLEEVPEKWARIIIDSYKEFNREAAGNFIKERGFDINTEVKELEDFFERV